MASVDLRKRLVVHVRPEPMDRDGAPWTPEEDALIGTAADRLIAAQINRSSVAVSNRRKKLGIKSFAAREEAQCPSRQAMKSPY